MTVRGILSDRSKWTTKWYARTAEGSPCQTSGKEAVCWCIHGAIERCYGDQTDEAVTALKKVREAIEDLFPDYRCVDDPDSHIVYNFNDCSITTFADVVEVLELANV